MGLDQAATIVISITVILGTLAIIAVGLRLYCRHVQKLSLGADDYLMLIALFLSTGTNILTDYVAATTGVGQSGYEPSLETIIFMLKCNFAGENANIACIGLVKLSILFFYRRIFIQRWFRICSTILLVLISSFTLAILLAIIFSKWPVEDQWNPTVPYNVNNAAVLIAYLSVNMVFDLATLALPLTALQQLQVDAQRRLILASIFSLGSLCIVASVLRLYYGVKYVHVIPSAASLFQAPFILNSLWANIEQPAFIICGCLLTFGPICKMAASQSKFSSYISLLRSALRRTGRGSTSNLDQEKYGSVEGLTESVPEENIRKTLTVTQSTTEGNMDGREHRGMSWVENGTFARL